MGDIVETTLGALKLARSQYNPGTAEFGKCSSIFLAPTGNVKDMMAKFKEAKRILAVGGAGAFGFEAMNNGAVIIDLFDNNELQKFFFEMVKAAMTLLSYEEFMKYFTLKSQKVFMRPEELRNLVSEELFRKIRILLSYEAQVIYENLYERFDSVDLIYSKLYRFEYTITGKYLKRFASMYDEESYYRIQAILRKKAATITYSTIDIRDLTSKYEGPYDLIVLGNIFQYYKDIPGLDSPYDVDKFVRKELSKILADDGVIQVNYAFNQSTIAFKEALNPSGLKLDSTTKQAMKNSVNIPLVKKWNYDYSFFAGVEPDDKGPTENMIITYKKR